MLFLFSNGSMSDLGTLPGGTISGGGAINQSGQVTGLSEATSFRDAHAFLFSNGIMADLGVLPGGRYSVGQGINQSGQVTGYANTSSGDYVAILYSNGTMQDLNNLIPANSGWVLQSGQSINDSGQITGYGLINGAQHAFLLNPVVTYKVLHNFGSSPGDPSCPGLAGTIAQSPGGNFYSSASDCLATDGGSVYKISVNGAVTVIYRFTSNTSGPRAPKGGLVFGTDQQFHGTTESGGIINEHGSVFRITPGGKLKTMYEFNGDLNGGAPVSAPIQSVSGHYYGTTPGEYGLHWGSIYKVTENGNFTLLHAFNGADGSFALGPLFRERTITSTESRRAEANTTQVLSSE